jgi:hypothetical protein
LTARIAQRRKALIREGIVDPMKPGEHVIAGRGGGGLDPASLERADMAARFRGRAGRAPASDEVVEMDYVDYTGTQPGTREAADADEPFAVGEEPESEEDLEFDLGEPSDEDPPPFILLREPEEPVRRRRPAPLAARSHDTDEILKGQEDLRERLDNLAAGLLAFAEGVGAALERIENPLVVVEAEPHASQFPEPTMQEIGRSDDTPFEEPSYETLGPVPRWLRVFGLR